MFHELQHENVEWSIAHTRLTPSISETKTNTYIYIYIIYIHVIDVIWDTHIRKLLYAILSNPGLKAIKLHSEWPIRPLQLGIMMADWAIA